MAIASGKTRWPVEVAVAVAVGVPTVTDAWWNQPGTRAADGLTYLLVFASVGALLVRRRWPVQVAALCGTTLTVLVVLGHRGELLNLPAAVALYTVAVSGSRRRSLLVGVAAVVWFGGLTWLVTDMSSAPIREILWPAVVLLLGEVVRGRRELLAEYDMREARATADRERQARKRMQQERLRIAREFHDVVAHTLAGVNVQMAVAVAAFAGAITAVTAILLLPTLLGPLLGAWQRWVVGATPMAALQKLAQSSDAATETLGSLGAWPSLWLVCAYSLATLAASGWLLHRGPVHRPALLHPRRHRPCQPQGAGQHDPPLHHLAKQKRRRERLRQVVNRANIA